MQVNSITSTTNPVIKEAIKIRDRHQQLRNEAFFIEGPHLLETALQAGGVGLKQVFFTEQFLSRTDGKKFFDSVLQEIGDTKRVFLVADEVMAKLSDTGAPQGVAAIVSIAPRTLDGAVSGDAPLLVACDGVQDPGNVGTIVRLADAVGADAVVMLTGCANPFSPKSVRSSAGSIFHLPVVFVEADTLVAFACKKGISLLIADARAPHTCYDADLRKPAIVVLGSEAHGVCRTIREHSEEAVSIPIIGRAESLNVAMSAAVILYEALRQRGLKA